MRPSTRRERRSRGTSKHDWHTQRRVSAKHEAMASEPDAAARAQVAIPMWAIVYMPILVTLSTLWFTDGYAAHQGCREAFCGTGALPVPVSDGL
jgi:uncharacterized protein involved in cysteine biosynthesis